MVLHVDLTGNYTHIEQFSDLKVHSCLRQVFSAGSPLKMMKNAFYFTSKALFVLRIFKFLS